MRAISAVAELFVKEWYMSQIVEKIFLSHNAEESFKKFLDSDPEVDYFQNLTSSSLSADTSVEKFSQRSVQ